MTSVLAQQAVKSGFKTTVLASMMLLTACGGGGGYYGNQFSGTGSSSSSSSTGTGSTGQSTAAAVNVGNVALYDPSNNVTRTVTVSGATATVKVTDASGKGISGALVTFSSTGGLIFGTSNSAVLTNADGNASISVKPSSVTDTGSYQLSAAVSYNGSTASSAAYAFSLQAASITFANMTAATPSLASGASTNITLKTLDATTNTNQNNVTVNFTTSCGSFDNATVVSSNQGDVTTTYKAIDANGKLCAGTQTITATGSNPAITHAVQVNIAAVTANSMVYTTSGAVNLAIKGSGSASSGQIQFTVFANGTPVANQDVTVELTKAPSDLSFVTLGNRQAQTVKSDASGKVSIPLYPGNLPGPVEVQAMLASNNNVYALSKNVAVATGRVSQNGLSISMSKNALRNDIDGDTATITVRMVDRTGNPVPDGTVISFVAEGGSVTPNCASVQGVCTVTLTTQNPRASNDRVSVLAYVEGDKAYTDVDGDNMYTPGVDTLTNNLGDAFRDDDESNVYKTGDFLYKAPVNSGASAAACGGSSIKQPNTGTCDNGLNAILRQQVLFAFASDTPTFVGLSGIDQSMTTLSSDNFSFQIYGNGIQTVPMPSGTTVTIATKDNTSNNNLTCTATLIGGDATVANVVPLLTPSTFPLSSNAAVKYSVALQQCAAGDYVTITTAVPGGKTTTLTIVR